MANAEYDRARDTLGALSSAPSLGALQKAEANLLLGLAVGELGDPAAAFAAAATGKELQRQYYANFAVTRESEADKLRRISKWFKQVSDRFQSSAAPATTSRAAKHVFLLGFPRSGTTLLEQLLAAHPDVRALEEEPLLAPAYEAFLSSDTACAHLAALGQEEAAAWAEHYWDAVQSRVPDVAGKLFVDKQPAGTINLPVIARLFPSARILFAIRDPRDVVLSCFRQPFQMNAMTYAFTDLGEAAACYDASMSFAALAQVSLPLAWLEVKHEDLIDDLEGQLSRILNFLELTSDEAMKDVATTAKRRPIRTPSAAQVRAGLNRRGLGRWRQYLNALEPVLPILAKWVKRFGYEP